MTSLEGQIAVVTGASGAIGGAVAAALAAEGVHLLLSGRDADKLDALAARLVGAGTRVETFAADLAAEEGCAALAARTTATFGAVDLLIHSLGLFAAGTIATAPVEDLDRQLAVNLRAPYALTRALLPSLLRRQGQVVFVNSSVIFHVRATVGAYAASKAGLKVIADVLRDEVNRSGRPRALGLPRPHRQRDAGRGRPRRRHPLRTGEPPPARGRGRVDHLGPQAPPHRRAHRSHHPADEALGLNPGARKPHRMTDA